MKHALIAVFVIHVFVFGAYWAMHNLRVGGVPEKQKEVATNVPVPAKHTVASATATPTKEVEKPAEIEGIIDPKHDVASFVGTPVPNECGTIGQPVDCLEKEVTVNLSEPWHAPFGGVRTDSSFYQWTLKTQDGGYITLAYAFNVSLGDEPNYNPDDHLVGSECPTKIEVGKPYRFGRNGETVVFRYGDHGEYRSYFLLLGKCSSVRECQSIPRRMQLSPNWKEAVAPWEWQEFRQRKQQAEQRKEYLDTPR